MNIKDKYFIGPISEASIHSNQMYEILKGQNMTYSIEMPVNYINIYKPYTYDKFKFNAKQSNIISLLSGKSKYNITDKIRFTTIFKDSGFIYNSEIISKNTMKYFDEPFIKLIKPDEGYECIDIKIIQTNKELEDYLNEKGNLYKNFIIQDYIIKPNLFKGYKFNLRVPVLVKIYNNELSVYYCKNSYIKRSEKKYKPKNFDDRDIHFPMVLHDKIMYMSDILSVFPKDRPDGFTDIDIKNIHKIICYYLKEIFQKENKFKPAWNAKNGFEVLGLDVIFENKIPYFLELNEKIGTFNILAKIIDNFTKSVAELTLFNKDYDKYKNFKKINFHLPLK